jgi:hypothetical protein
VTRFTLLGVPIDAVSEAEAVDWIARAIAEGRPRLVISVNPERIMRRRVSLQSVQARPGQRRVTTARTNCGKANIRRHRQGS